MAPSYDIVGIAKNGRELTELALQFKPELVLTDLSMPQLNGMDAIQSLTEKGLRSKFIVLTMHEDMSLAVLVFRAGASGFLLKSAHSEELLEALRIVQRGGHYLSSQFSCDLITVLAEAARRPAVDRVPQLTRRQRDVLKLVAEGRTMKEVAGQFEYLDAHRRVLQISPDERAWDQDQCRVGSACNQDWIDHRSSIRHGSLVPIRSLESSRRTIAMGPLSASVDDSSLESLIEALPDACVVIDESGILLFANQVWKDLPRQADAAAVSQNPIGT